MTEAAAKRISMHKEHSENRDSIERLTTRPRGRKRIAEFGYPSKINTKSVAPFLKQN